jgi:RNAse (barnase) inhibitor barstar
MTKSFVIDGDNFSDFQGFTKEFSKSVLSNKHIWNGSLDAFNDILRGGFGDIEEDDEIEITWKNSNKSINDLGYDETIKRLLEKYEKCHPTNKEFVLQEIYHARNKNGPTVFDWIVEIINEHENKNITLKLK